MASAVTLVCSLFFCLLLVNASPWPSRGGNNNKFGPFLGQMKNSQRQCFDYFKSSLKKVLMQALGKLKKGDDESNSQVKCFITCLLKKTGVVKGDDAEFDLKPVLAKLKNPADKEAVTSASDTCKAEAAKGATACDKGYIFIDCIFKAVTQGKSGAADAEEPADPDAGADADADGEDDAEDYPEDEETTEAAA